MKSTEPYHERIRAIVLAGVMVLSVIAMATSFAGTTGAVPAGVNDGISELNDSDRLYQGEIGVVDDAWLDSIETADLYETDGSSDEDHTWLRELTVYGNVSQAADETELESDELQNISPTGNFVVINTEDLQTSGHHLTITGDNSSNIQHQFDVREQTLDASFDDDTISSAGGEVSETNLVIDSNRATFHANVSAEGLDAADLEDIFADGDAANDSDVIALDEEEDVIYLAATGAVDANFTDISAGNYTFNVGASDTTASDTVDIEVIEDEIERQFVQNTYEYNDLSIANLTIDLDGSDTAAVRIGDWETKWYEVGLTIDAEDFDKDIVHLKMNIFLAGGGEVPDEAEGFPLPFSEDTIFYVFSAQDTDIDIETEYKMVGAQSNLQARYFPNGEMGTTRPFDSQISQGNYEIQVGDSWNESSFPHTTPTPGGHGITMDERPEINSVQDTAFLTVTGLDVGSVLSEGSLELVRRAPAEAQIVGQENLNETNITATDTIVEGEHLIIALEGMPLGGAIDALGRLALWDVVIHNFVLGNVNQWTHDQIDESEVDFGDAANWKDMFGRDRDGVEIGSVLAEFGDIYVETRMADLPPNSEHAWNTSGYEDANELPHHITMYGLNLDDYDDDLYAALDYESVGLEAEDQIEIFFNLGESDITSGLLGGDSGDGPAIDLTSLLTFNVAIQEPEATFESTEVEATESATIRGSTNLAPGSELTLQATASGQFIKTAETEVKQADDGSSYFETQMNFAAEQPGVGFDLEVRGPLGLEEDTEATVIQGEAVQPASFSASGTAPSNVEPGDAATLDVAITNDGDEAGSTNLTVTINGTEVTSETIELDGGEEYTESHSLDTETEGEIEWSIETDSDADSGTVSVSAPTEEPDNGTDDGADDGEEDDTPGFGAVVALVALIAVALLAKRRTS